MAENKGILPSSTFNTLGNNSNKWEAVYANKIVGPLTGNVTGNCSGSSSSCTGNSATATSANYSTSAGNADTLDGYHYNDIINNVKSVGMGFPNYNAVIEFSIRAGGTTYTIPSNGYILTGTYGDGKGANVFTSIGNSIFHFRQFIPVSKNTLIKAVGYEGLELNCNFYPCL